MEELEDKLSNEETKYVKAYKIEVENNQEDFLASGESREYLLLEDVGTHHHLPLS